MDILKVISQTIDVVDVCHIKFSTSFYNLDDIKKHKLRSLKRIYVSEAKTNDYFIKEFLPTYYSALENSDVDNSLLEFFSPFAFNPDIDYHFRIKMRDSTSIKLAHYAYKEKRNNSYYPLNKCLNDIYGVRLILKGVNSQKIEVKKLLDSKKADNKLKKYYYRDRDGYKSFQCYFEMSNKVLPWELQIWDLEDKDNNARAHVQHEREKNII